MLKFGQEICAVPKNRAIAFTSRASVVVALIAACAAPSLATQVPGVGWEAQGADVVVTNLDGNPRPDLIFMAYDNPARDNSFRYRVARNVNAVAETANWTSGFIQVAGVGWEGSGAGAAVTNLDGDARPELILMAYDNPARDNSFRYRVGFNLNESGVAANWATNFIQVAGVGWEGQGADVIITSLDADPRPDMVLMAYDNPSRDNNFRYKVGFNLNATGQAASWSGTVQVNGVGWEGAGAGAAFANLDNDPRPELVLMAYDNPARDNTFRWRVGWNLNASGVANNWDAGFATVPGLGWEGQGAGLAIANFDGDPRPDWLLMAYDNPARDNTFRYVVLPNRGAAQAVGLEVDRLTGEDWLPANATRNGATFTPAQIFNDLGIGLTVTQDETLTNPLPPGQACFTDGDLLSLQNARRNRPPGANSWHMYMSITTCHQDDLFGVMYDTGPRRGFSEFFDAVTDVERRTRTFAHELGHALCLLHNDGDAWRPGGPVAGTGRTVMNPTWSLATDWSYGWEQGSMGLAYDKSKARWRPESGFGFGNCH